MTEQTDYQLPAPLKDEISFNPDGLVPAIAQQHDH